MSFPDWLRRLPSGQVTYIKEGIDMLGHEVRIAPTQKKVLRSVGEILDEAGRRKQLTVVQNVVSIIEGGRVWYIADLLTQVVVEQNAPEWFFTTEEPNR